MTSHKRGSDFVTIAHMPWGIRVQMKGRGFRKVKIRMTSFMNDLLCYKLKFYELFRYKLFLTLGPINKPTRNTKTIMKVNKYKKQKLFV